MADNITLDRLFHFQDEALEHNTVHSVTVQERLRLVREAIALSAIVLTSMKFSNYKQHVLRVLGTDCLSSIVTSVRVGLWGNLPESVALLRSALESTAISAAVVQTREYAVLCAEFRKKLSKYNFKRASFILGGFGSRIIRLWGTLSNIGAHSTAFRMRFSSYQMSGEFVDRLAAAFDHQLSENALFYTPDVCLALLISFELAYTQDSVEFPEAARLDSLKQDFNAIIPGTVDPKS
ncbi:MAG: hypothetical protein LAO31_21245 [Acidobacteriia bacterium]|nr:hypothetical protein [Terriglobia bacterium]